MQPVEQTAALVEAAPRDRPASELVHAGASLDVQVGRTITARRNQPAVSQPSMLISGVHVIGSDGYLNLGPAYGMVHVAELPIDEIQNRVDTHLRHVLQNPQVLVTLSPSQDTRPTSGGQLGVHRPRFLEPSIGPRLSRKSHDVSQRNGRLSRFRTVSRRSTYQPRLPSCVASHTVEVSSNEPVHVTTSPAAFERSLKIPDEPSSDRSPITAPRPREVCSLMTADGRPLPTASESAAPAPRFHY